MKLLPILEYPDPRLRIKAQPLTETDFTPELQEQIDAMLHTMYAAPGIGLAATQVDFHKQLIVIDISDSKDEPLILINPSFSPVEEVKEALNEACLSVPEYNAEIDRYLAIEVTSLDRHGQEQNFTCDGLLAHCIQHECDHLQGVVYVDYLSRLKQDRLRKKLQKMYKERA